MMILIFLFIVFFFFTETLYIDDLENLLYQGGLSISIVIEDGSDEEVFIFIFYLNYVLVFGILL
jgi:hypothetical protein